MFLKEIIAAELSKELKTPEKELIPLIEFPSKKEYDLCLPCFSLARQEKKNPEEIALNLKQKIKSNAFEIHAIGSFLNFSFNPKFFLPELSFVIEKEKIPLIDLGQNKKIMIEFSQPNPNKPMHLGHLRNDSIGMALSNILSFFNFNVIKANLINDRGIHICQMMLAYKLFGENKKPEDLKLKGDHFVGHFYVLFQEKAKENPELNEKAQELLRKWEQKDKETINLWKKLRDFALNGFNETYKVFGSKFDIVFFESDFYDKAKELIDLGLKKGVFKREKDNSIIVKLTDVGLPDKTVVRADGTTIYFTNDLILTKYKFEHFNLDHCIWVVASEQDLYFKQLFKTFELLGFPWHNKCEHLSYGLVLLPEGKMKSREGKVVDADEIIDLLKEKAKKELLKRNPKLKEKELSFRAEKIALAAIKFYILMHDLKKDFTFKTEESISFEGNTGPYLLYSYARAKSILRKIKFNKKELINALKETTLTEKEKIVLRKICLFNDVLNYALEKRAIHFFASFLIDLAAQFNLFYDSVPVLKAKEKERNARIAIVLLFALYLKKALELLNIEVLEEM